MHLDPGDSARIGRCIDDITRYWLSTCSMAKERAPGPRLMGNIEELKELAIKLLIEFDQLAEKEDR